MKVVVSGVLVLLLLSLYMTTTNAQDASSTATPTKTRLETMREKRETIKENIQERIENFRDKIQLQRERARKLFGAKREAFKDRLEELKDTRKKVLVERVDTKISAANQRRTNHFLEVIERLQEILDRIEKKAQDARVDGLDTSAVDSAIADAKEAILAAQNAVFSQAGKDYVINITNQTGLKNAVGEVMSQFRQDLRDTHKTVVDARQKVRKAAKELAKLISARGINNPTGATESSKTD